MLNFLPSSIILIISIILYVTNIIIFSLLVLPFAILKFIIPIQIWRDFMSKVLTSITTTWANLNTIIMLLTKKIEFDIQMEGDYSKKKSYFVISNHQAWTDILILLELLNRKIPYFRFFLKDSLKKIPLMGMVWWALDYPFMKRYSKEFLKKNPHLKGKDIEATKKACEKFKNIPVTIANFPEGTRFNKEKHKKQNSPYKHLLLPKAGGLAIVLSSIELETILDVTIIYHNNFSLKYFLSGELKKVTIIVKKIEITEDLIGDYINDLDFKKGFQKRINEIWESKDKLIEKVKSEKL